jgi:hypothetical protein
MHWKPELMRMNVKANELRWDNSLFLGLYSLHSEKVAQFQIPALGFLGT